MASDRRRRHLFAAGLITLLLVAALVLPPLININRYQRKIAASLAAGLGHPVEISGVKLHLLPRPGVEIANFAVDSNAGFSAEPMLECSSVTAAFRLTSLWRGRLEIARISLDEPSLNLERASDGQWNFASVLVQASRTPLAPTGKPLAGGQNRFPYIEASSARINFKHGYEKLPFSFLNADVSIWLERPDEWQLRFTAQPMRTDMNLSLADTGLVQVDGSVHRASSANQLPLDMRAEWNKAPLGQVTRMLMLQDLGWRGDTSLTVHITGIPDALRLNLTAAAGDFHRETFAPAHPLNLHVTCTATYLHAQGSLNEIRCLSPVGDGKLDLTGDLQQIHTADPQPDLKLVATQVPVAAALELLRHTRGRFAEDVTLNGTIDGDLAYAIQPQKNGSHTIASGSLQAADLLLRADGVEQILPDLHFTVRPTQPLSLVLQPAQLDLGEPQPMLADARLTRQDFLLHYSGSGQLAHLLPLVHAFHVLPPAFQGLQGDGAADYNLTVQGDWLLPLADRDQPSPSSAISGSVSLRDVAFQPSYLAEPVQVATATASVSPTDLRWNAITASLGSTHFSGSLDVPTACRIGGCQRRFDLTAPSVNLGALAASLRGEDQGVVEEWMNHVRARNHDWPELAGSIHVGKLITGQVEIAGAAADLVMQGSKLNVTAFDGRTLGGAIHATSTVALDSKAAYDAHVQLTHASAAELSQLLQEHWGPGLLDVSAKLSTNGASASDMSDSAKGVLQWQWLNGALPQLTATPLRRFDRWTGEGKLAKGSLAITHSEVASSGISVPVTGTIGTDRSLDLKIGSATADTTTAISGTLAAPIVESH